MYTICTENDVIDIVEKDELLKQSPSFLVKVSGTVTESILHGKDIKRKLNFDSKTSLKLRKITHLIKNCIDNDNLCHNLRKVLTIGKDKVVNVDITLEEIADRYFVNNIIVNGNEDLLKVKRARRSCFCPPGFICHGCENVTPSPLKGAVKSLRHCEGGVCGDDNVREFNVEFHIHKSHEKRQSNQEPVTTKPNVKSIKIKRIFGSNIQSERSNVNVADNVLSTLKKAFSEVATRRSR